jgi:hypothetical protein
VTTYPNDPYVLQVQAPGGISAGTDYSVCVSNGYGSGTENFDRGISDQTIQGRTSGSDVFGLGVPWGADFANIAASVINVVSSTNPHTHASYGADDTGGANSVNAIQQALYDAGNPAYHPNGATVYLPTGTYLIDNAGENTTFTGTNGKTLTQPANITLQLPAHVVIKGDGIGQTVINDATDAMPSPGRAISYMNPTSDLSGMLNLTYLQTGTVVSGSTAPSAPVITVIGSKSFFSNMNITFAHSNPPYALGGAFNAGGGCHNVLVQNITMDYGLFAVQCTSGTGSNFLIRNNVLTHHGAFYRTRVKTLGAINLLFENNHCTRDSQWPGPLSGPPYNVWEQGQTEIGKAPYSTILNNTYDTVSPPLIDTGDGETIADQTQPTQYAYDNVTSADATSINDATASWSANVFAGHGR